MEGFFITCMNENYGHLLRNPKLWAEDGRSRTFGWYDNKADAFEAIENNYSDMHETCYVTAVIEELPQGIHPFTVNRWWFKYNKVDGKWKESNEPEWANKIVNFALG